MTIVAFNNVQFSSLDGLWTQNTGDQSPEVAVGDYSWVLYDPGDRTLNLSLASGIFPGVITTLYFTIYVATETSNDVIITVYDNLNTGIADPIYVGGLTSGGVHNVISVQMPFLGSTAEPRRIQVDTYDSNSTVVFYGYISDEPVVAPPPPYFWQQLVLTTETP